MTSTSPHEERTEAPVVWLTGLSGAGKTTIAHALVERLQQLHRPVELFDGDLLRDVMPTGFSRRERDDHVRRVGFFASRLARHGVIVVASLISPYRGSRDYVRGVCPRFIEVHVSTSLAECERRDVKGLYARARKGELQSFTGIDDPYEAPERPEVELDTSVVSVEEAVTRLLQSITKG